MHKSSPSAATISYNHRFQKISELLNIQFHAWDDPSLVPRLLGGGGKKEPGIHCMRIRLIIVYSNTCISMGMCKLRIHTKGVCMMTYNINSTWIAAELYARIRVHIVIALRLI